MGLSVAAGQQQKITTSPPKTQDARPRRVGGERGERAKATATAESKGGGVAVSPGDLDD